MTALSPELSYTALTAALTGSLWIPIIVNRLLEMGPWKALKNPEPDVRPHANWATKPGAPETKNRPPKLRRWSLFATKNAGSAR